MNRFSAIGLIISVTFALFVGATSFMSPECYSSVWWKTLWAIFAVVLVSVIFKARLWRDISLFMIHISFVLMIAGGLCTSFFSISGTLHLRPNETAEIFISAEGKVENLPAKLTLHSFRTLYHPGMSFPKDFVSEVIVDGKDTMRIAMNHIGRLENYRFYQASFDDEGGTVLTVSHDPVGTGLVYAGFLLFLVGGLSFFIRKTLKRKRIKAFALVMMTVFFTADVFAVPAVSEEIARGQSCTQVSWQGDVVPFNTVATELTYKLTGRADVGGLSPEAFVMSLMRYRKEWSGVPFLKVKDRTLRKALGAEGKYVSVDQLYNEEGEYIPGHIYRGGEGNLDKEIIVLDEKIAILANLWEGSLFTRPDSTQCLRSDFSVKAEVLYNRASPVFILFLASLSAALVYAFLGKKRQTWHIELILAFIGTGVILWHWYFSRRLPLSSGSGIMQFMAVCVTFLTAYAGRRDYSRMIEVCGLLLAAFFYFVAWLGIKDPVMTPVMPVLASPWLSLHVSLVMAAYATLGFSLPVSLAALIRIRHRQRLTQLSLSLLAPGTFLLALGIAVGAMWANVSWGRYWAWDPKETWSLVTLLLYSIPMHRFFRMGKHCLLCNVYIVIVFSAILMTYFGVSFMSSLHAYN